MLGLFESVANKRNAQNYLPIIFLVELLFRVLTGNTIRVAKCHFNRQRMFQRSVFSSLFD